MFVCAERVTALLIAYAFAVDRSARHLISLNSIVQVSECDEEVDVNSGSYPLFLPRLPK